MSTIYVEITNGGNGHAPSCPLANPCNHCEYCCCQPCDGSDYEDADTVPLLASQRHVPMLEYPPSHAPSHRSSRSRAPTVVSRAPSVASRGRSVPSGQYPPAQQYDPVPSYSYASTASGSRRSGTVRSYGPVQRLIEYPARSAHGGSSYGSRPPPVQYAGSARGRAPSVYSTRSYAERPPRAASVASSARTYRTSTTQRNGRDRDISDRMSQVSLNGGNHGPNLGPHYRGPGGGHHGGEARGYYDAASDDQTIQGGAPLGESRYGEGSRHGGGGSRASTVGRRSQHGGSSHTRRVRGSEHGGGRRRSFLSRFGL